MHKYNTITVEKLKGLKEFILDNIFETSWKKKM